MELAKYLQILQRRKWVVIVTTLLAIGVAVVVSNWITPRYTAVATLRVLTGTDGSVSDVRFNTSYSDRILNTYARLATSAPILEALSQRMGLQTLPDIDVELFANTELMQLLVTDEDPAVARDAANALADILISESSQPESASGVSTADILAEQLAEAERALNEARTQLDQLLTDEVQNPEAIAALRRAVELNEETYNRLFDQYLRALGTEALRVTTISLVEPAQTPEAPSSPNRPLMLAIAGLLGLIGGSGLAFVLEHSDSRLESAKSVADSTGLPVLGVISGMRLKKGASVVKGESFSRDEFRRLGINLFPSLASPNGSGPALNGMFSRDQAGRLLAAGVTSYEELAALSPSKLASILAVSEQTVKEEGWIEQARLLASDVHPKPGSAAPVVLIASAKPQEGKSTIAANLAVSLAQLGKRVALVDGDLRQPSLHSIFKVSVEPGLTNVVKGETTLELALHETDYPNLFLLPRGTQVPDTAQLLASPQTHKLIEQLRKNFDIVLLDSPALLAIMDGTVLARLADKVIIVVRRNYSLREEVAAVENELRFLGANVVGTVVNGAKRDNRYHYYRHYHRAAL